MIDKFLQLHIWLKYFLIVFCQYSKKKKKKVNTVFLLFKKINLTCFFLCFLLFFIFSFFSELHSTIFDNFSFPIFFLFLSLFFLLYLSEILNFFFVYYVLAFFLKTPFFFFFFCTFSAFISFPLSLLLFLATFLFSFVLFPFLYFS